MNPPHNSILSRLLSRAAPIEPEETGAVVAAFCLFFFMWAGYFAVRPVRETIGTIIGPEQTADLWFVTWLVSLAIIPLVGIMVARFRRSVFLPWSYGIVAGVLAIVGFSFGEKTVDPFVGKFFYVFISVVNLLLLSMFWSFLLELFRREQTKRLFGVIAAGGSAGALIGPLVSDFSVSLIGNRGVMFIGAMCFVVAIFCLRALLTIWALQSQTNGSAQAAASHGFYDRPLGGNLFAGVTLILRSPYLLGIALFVVMISLVSTVLYFEQQRLIKLAYPILDDRTQIFARMDWIVQALTLIGQILLTGRIAARSGVTALLTFVPALMVVGFLYLAVHDSVMVVAVVFVVRRACEYAFIRPGREMLWSVLDTETRYKAKSTIDVPVYRGADALAAQLTVGIAAAGFGTAAVAMLGAVVALLWGLNGRWLGRRFARVEAQLDLAAKRSP